MKRLFAALDVDFDQWWALTKVALKVDLRASSFMRASRLSRETRAIGALVGQFIFYTLMGGAIAAVVWFTRDLFLSSTIVLTYVMFMVGTAALLDHNAAIISPDDYGILGYRPITSRTYFAARLTNVLVYTTAITTLLAYLPLVVYFLRRGPAIGFAALIAVYAASSTVALGMVAAYAWLLRTVGPVRLKRALSYVQLVMSFIVYGGYFGMSRMISEKALAGLALTKTIWTLLLPSTWFASYLELAARRTTPMEWVPAAASVALLAALIASLSGRLSLTYAERIGAISTTAREAASRTRRSGRAWLFTAGEGRAVALLIRSQFKNDMKFRMSVLAILPLTLIYLFMGLSRNGTVGDAFVQGQSSMGLRNVTIAMLMFPTLLKVSLGRSDAFRASWIFFACPIDRTRMVRAARNVLVTGFLLPYIAVVAVVLSFYTPSVPHLLVHLTVVGLLSLLALQVVTLLEPELPFSRPMQRNRSAPRTFTLMFVIGVGSVILPLAAPVMYRSVWSIALVLAVLAAASVTLDRLTRLRIESQAEDLEFEG